jgi:uncharacterized protein YjbI with pentapeptide repeats
MHNSADLPPEVQKQNLEIEKLLRERQLLDRQLSTQGLLIEWLKAAAVPITLLGAIVAFYTGFGQLQQASRSQAADRFDKALSRLSSDRVEEKLTGISGLQLFLESQDAQFQEQTLQYLINALSLEKDDRVQGAILDAILGVKPEIVGQTALNSALANVIARNRNLTELIDKSWRKKTLEEQIKLVISYNIEGVKLDHDVNEIPAAIITKLNTDQYLKLVSLYHRAFDSTNIDNMFMLRGLTQATEILFAKGASINDLHGIYCEGCDFKSAKGLRDSNFDNSYLSRADFSHVDLRNSSFRDADIGGTDFFAADLGGANLSLDTWALRKAVPSKGYAYMLPVFECATLDGADLTGQPLVLFARSTNAETKEVEIESASLMQSKTNNTKIDSFSIINVNRVTDSYLKKYPTDETFHINKGRGELWGDPILSGYASRAILARRFADFAEDSDNYTSTIAYTVSSIDHEAMSRLGGEAYYLRIHFDKPEFQYRSQFKDLPTALTFLDKLEAVSTPKETDTGALPKEPPFIESKGSNKRTVDCAGGSPRFDTLFSSNFVH